MMCNRCCRRAEKIYAALADPKFKGVLVARAWADIGTPDDRADDALQIGAAPDEFAALPATQVS